MDDGQGEQRGAVGGWSGGRGGGAPDGPGGTNRAASARSALAVSSARLASGAGANEAVIQS